MDHRGHHAARSGFTCLPRFDSDYTADSAHVVSSPLAKEIGRQPMWPSRKNRSIPPKILISSRDNHGWVILEHGE
jgi:hypothetical protein